MPADGGDCVLVAEGGVVGGFTPHVEDRRPVYEYRGGNVRLSVNGKPLSKVSPPATGDPPRSAVPR
jgi:hypothetical protein